MLVRIFDRKKTAHDFPDHNCCSLKNLFVCCGFTGNAENGAQFILNNRADFITGDAAVVHKLLLTP